MLGRERPGLSGFIKIPVAEGRAGRQIVYEAAIQVRNGGGMAQMGAAEGWDSE